MDVKMVDLLREAGYVPLQVRPVGFGITKEEYSEQFHCTVDAARGILDKAFRDGIVGKTIMLHERDKVAVYHKIGAYPE